MKTLIISAILLFATSAFAVSGYDICKRINSSSSLTQCAKEIKGKDFDPQIIGVCNRINSSSSVVACAKAAANNVYDSKIIKVCNRINSSSSIVDCVSAAANKVYESYEVDLCSRLNSSSSIVQCVRDGGSRGQKQGACYQQEQDILDLEDELSRARMDSRDALIEAEDELSIANRKLRNAINKIETAKEYALNIEDYAYDKNLIYAYEQAQLLIRTLEERARRGNRR